MTFSAAFTEKTASSEMKLQTENLTVGIFIKGCCFVAWGLRFTGVGFYKSGDVYGMRFVINGRDYEPDQHRFEVGESFSITG